MFLLSSRHIYFKKMKSSPRLKLHKANNIRITFKDFFTTTFDKK